MERTRTPGTPGIQAPGIQAPGNRQSRTLHLAVAALGTGLVACVLQCVILRRGIWLTPDSWAYWCGSVNLLHGNGYTWFFGDPIAHWPPLYSVYLAGWQLVFGVSGTTLVLATAVTSGAAAALWLFVLCRLRDQPRPPWTAGAFLALLFAASERRLMAENLLYLLLPLLLFVAVLGARAPERRSFVRAALAFAVLAAAILLTKLAALALVAAGAALLLANRQQPLAMRLSTLTVAILAALAPIAWQRLANSAEWSHPVGFGAARHTPLEYVLQVFRGFGDRFAPAPIGIVVWLFLAVVLWRERRDRPLLVYALLGTAILFAMFNVMFVNAELKGRFLFFAPLITGAVVLLQDHRGKLGFALAVLVLALPTIKIARHVVKTRGMDPPHSDQHALDAHFARTHFTIDPNRNGPIAPRDALLLVTPPGREWVRARLEER